MYVGVGGLENSEVVPSSQKEPSIFIIKEVHTHSKNLEICNYFETIKWSLRFQNEKNDFFFLIKN